MKAKRIRESLMFAICLVLIGQGILIMFQDMDTTLRMLPLIASVSIASIVALFALSLFY